MAAGETNIGGIVGFLRLEAGQFHREIQQALLEIEALSDKDVRVSVKTDGAAGLQRLPAATRSATQGVDNLVAAQRRLEDATGRLNLAQMRLSELNESGRAKASQLMRAQMDLAKAQRDEEDAITGVGRARRESAESASAANTRLARTEEDVAKRQERTARATGENRRQTSLLVTAIGTLGPALVPLAAGAVGLTAGFGGMLTAGVLAFKGIKDAMEAGNAVGVSYKNGLDELKGDLEKLGATAASGLLAPFQETVKDVTSRMGELNDATETLTAITGDAARHLVSGLLNAFIALQPLIQDAANYVDQLARKFDALTSGPGLKEFGDYVQSVLPLVMDTLGSLVTTVGKLVAAFAPLGGGVLNVIRLLSEAINAIDPQVLTVLASAAGAVFVGFRSWRGLKGLVDGLASALGGVETMSSRAATGIRGLTIATGVIGVALAALSWIFTSNAEAQREAVQATDDFAEALRRSNGVIDEGVRKVAYDTLQKKGAIDAAKALGIGVGDLVDASLRQGDAYDRVLPKVMDAIANDRQHWGEAKLLQGVLRDVNNELIGGAQSNADWADASKGSTVEADKAAAAAQRLADKYGWSATTLQQVEDGQRQMAEQTALATAKMQEQNDAAGLLKIALDELNGKEIDNARAQNAYDRSRNALGSPVKQAEEKLANARKQQAGLSSGHAAGGSAAVSRAQDAYNAAQHRLQILQASGKATALQLASAQDRVTAAGHRLAEAQAKAGRTVGGASKAQRDAAAAAVKQAEAELAAAKTLKGTSDAAVTNRENILNMIEAGNRAVGTNGNLARSNKDARQKLIDVRADILKTAKSWGFNAQEVQALLDKYDKVPDYIEPTKFQADTKEATKDTREWVGVINGVPTWRTTKLNADTAEALRKKQQLQESINRLRGKTVTLRVNEVFAYTKNSAGSSAAADRQYQDGVGSRGAGSANAAEQANGGIRFDGIRKMADGGFAGRQSSIMRSTKPILWNEAPGGEAYISLAPQKRARSMAVYGEVGRILGASAGKGAVARMHPEDIKAIGKELALAVRQMPRPRVELDEFNRRLA